MDQSAYVSIITINGKVTEVEGNPTPKTGLFEGLLAAPFLLMGKSTTDALIACDTAGYEVMTTENIQGKVVYRLKLKPR